MNIILSPASDLVPWGAMDSLRNAVREHLRDRPSSLKIPAGHFDILQWSKNGAYGVFSEGHKPEPVTITPGRRKYAE